MPLTIPCPKCRGSMQVRTSERPTNTTVTALLYCPSCMNIRAHFMGEFTKIEYATFSENDPDNPRAPAKPTKAASQLDLVNEHYLS